MTRRRIGLAPAAFVVVAILLVVLLTSGGNPYVAKLEMTNANGLKDGSPVTIGGIRVGTVDVGVDVDRGLVVAKLRIDPKHAPIARDASAAIVAQNLLGQKSVRIDPGNPALPAPSGAVIPRQRITKATDLDQILNVLDADTRTRLAIFVNESGTAFTGRRADFNRFLRDIGPAVSAGTDLLRDFGRENDRLRAVLSHSDRFVAETTGRRRDVVRMVDRFGQAAATAAVKRVELRRTLAETPGALTTLQTFLVALRKTTGPLDSAAGRLSVTAGPLRAALAQLEPFRKRAAPVLRTAREVAPDLERLAVGGTPVLRKTRATASALRASLGKDFPPVTKTLDGSIENILAVMENWDRAIQFRDQMGHQFRGEGAVSPDLLASAIRRLAPDAEKKRGGAQPRPGGRPSPEAKRPDPPAAGRPGAPKLPKLPIPGIGPALDSLPDELKDSIDKALGNVGVSGDAAGRPRRTTDSFFDRIFGL